MNDLISRMNDLISRQALIEHLRRTIEASSNDGDYSEGFNDGMDFAACFASTLPSVQPERKSKPISVLTCHGCVHKNTWDEECKQCIRLWSYLHDNYEEERT